MSAGSFHAAPRPGEWFNDPNGLAYVGGRFRLFVQHASDPPDFAERGWARLSSPDLLRWNFDGAVLPADERGRRYSGSVLPRRDALEAFLTLDDPGAQPRQRQINTISLDAGLTWRERLDFFGPSGRDVRDPFVWRSAEGSERMLVAHPGAWEAADQGKPSFLSLWTRTGDGHFEQTGTIGPWQPPGVLWEVPGVIDFGGLQVVLISIVDRRAGGTRCEVRYWLGHLGDCGFDVAKSFPADGRPLDLGPDFYAAVPNAPDGWPQDRRMIVAWAAQWGRVHQPLQGQGHGGPITMPRVVTLEGNELHVATLPEALPLAHWSCTWDTEEPCRLALVSSSGTWHFAFAGGQVEVQHPSGARTAELPCQQGRRTAQLFVDGDLIELFVAGITFTVRGTFVDIVRG